MPKAKERKQDDKIKNQGKRKEGKPVQEQARRVMTAKLRKELVQQKQAARDSSGDPVRDDASASATTEAVEQMEQTAGASVQETGQQVKQGVSKAIARTKQRRQELKERRDQPKEPEQSPEGPISETPEASIPGQHEPPRPNAGQTAAPPSTARTPAPKVRPSQARTDPPVLKVKPADAEVPSPVPSTPARPLTPEDRMRQLAVEKRRKLTGQSKESPALPGRFTPTYGGKPVSPGTPAATTKPASLENQSIHQSIKERPHSSTILKEKRQSWTIAPRTRQSIEPPARSAAIPTKAPAPIRKGTLPQRIRDRARRKAQREAQRGMAQGAKKTAKAAVGLSKKAAAASAKAVKALISALSALIGGGTLIAALCVIFLIAAVIASPFGLLFSNEPSPGAVPLNAAVTPINVELTDKLALLQAGDYDSIDIQGSGPDWREVAAVFACKTSLGADGLDVAALTPDRVNRLKAVFWDMCEITTSVETIDHPASGNNEAWTETILHITVTAKTADEMRAVYLFTPEQNRALTELLAELNVIGSLLGDLGISQEDAAELLRHLPDDLSPERRAVIETACKLVGKVNYFWGGKSLMLGWDSHWGTIQKVWAAGSPSTGTYRPYGMDCSGFVDWVFYNMSGGSYIIGHGGGARMQHSYCTPISWSQAQPGDLVFYPEDTHVGIVGGWDESGNIQIIHCASGQNNVVITGKAGFTSIGRPEYYG